ncbi:hypothetical protein [Pelobacter propionicus]|nr:hypothetical protein [Pelobacter propionicus]
MIPAARERRVREFCERCGFSLRLPIVSTSLHFSLITGFGGGLLPDLSFT